MDDAAKKGIDVLKEGIFANMDKKVKEIEAEKKRLDDEKAKKIAKLREEEQKRAAERKRVAEEKIKEEAKRRALVEKTKSFMTKKINIASENFKAAKKLAEEKRRADEVTRVSVDAKRAEFFNNQLKKVKEIEEEIDFSGANKSINIPNKIQHVTEETKNALRKGVENESSEKGKNDLLATITKLEDAEKTKDTNILLEALKKIINDVLGKFTNKGTNREVGEQQRRSSVSIPRVPNVRRNSGRNNNDISIPNFLRLRNMNI